MEPKKQERIILLTSTIKAKFSELEEKKNDIMLEIEAMIDDADIDVGITKVERKALKATAKALANDRIEQWEDDLRAMLEVRGAQTRGGLLLRLWGEEAA